MKFMLTWQAKPGALREAVDRFLAGLGAPPEGVTLLGRWHKVDCSSGFSLCQSTNPSALFESSAVWTDIMDLQITPVVEDAEAGPIYAKIFQKNKT